MYTFGKTELYSEISKQVLVVFSIFFSKLRFSKFDESRQVFDLREVQKLLFTSLTVFEMLVNVGNKSWFIKSCFEVIFLELLDFSADLTLQTVVAVPSKSFKSHPPSVVLQIGRFVPQKIRQILGQTAQVGLEIVHVNVRPGQYCVIAGPPPVHNRYCITHQGVAELFRYITLAVGIFKREIEFAALDYLSAPFISTFSYKI